MRYFARDVEQITIPQTGHIHRRPEGVDQLVVDCAACDPHMARYGAVLHAGDTPLTYDEKRELEAQEKLSQQYIPVLARAMGEAGMQVLANKNRQ